MPFWCLLKIRPFVSKSLIDVLHGLQRIAWNITYMYAYMHVCALVSVFVFMHQDICSHDFVVVCSWQLFVCDVCVDRFLAN